MEKADRTSPILTIYTVVEVTSFNLEDISIYMNDFNLALYLQPWFVFTFLEIKCFLTDWYTLHKHLALASYPEAYTIKVQSV